MKIIAKINFSANKKKYIKGEEIKDLNYKQILKLNELGFIEPLTYEQLVNIEREFKSKEEL